MDKVILNRVAIWQAKNNDEFAMRPSPAGRVYFENGIAKKAEKPMARYAKNYKIGKGKSAIKFCLFFMTFSESAQKIEAFLDDTAKTISKEYAQRIVASPTSDFEYTDITYEEQL